MGLTGATAEDAEAEYIKKICDHEIVTGMTNKQTNKQTNKAFISKVLS